MDFTFLASSQLSVRDPETDSNDVAGPSADQPTDATVAALKARIAELEYEVESLRIDTQIKDRQMSACPAPRRAGLRLASTGRCCPLRLAVRLPRHTPAQPRSVVGRAGRFSSVRGIRAWPRMPCAFSAGRAFAAGQRFHLSGAFGDGPSAALLPRSTLACSPFASSRLRPV